MDFCLFIGLHKRNQVNSLRSYVCTVGELQLHTVRTSSSTTYCTYRHGQLVLTAAERLFYQLCRVKLGKGESADDEEPNSEASDLNIIGICQENELAEGWFLQGCQRTFYDAQVKQKWNYDERRVTGKKDNIIKRFLDASTGNGSTNQILKTVVNGFTYASTVECIISAFTMGDTIHQWRVS